MENRKAPARGAPNSLGGFAAWRLSSGLRSQGGRPGPRQVARVARAGTLTRSFFLARADFAMRVSIHSVSGAAT
jgi:hypothetical protein